jgi:26S proteasome regulatory subunit N9
LSFSSRPDPADSLEFITSLHSRLAHPYPPVDASTGEPASRPPPPAAEAYALSLSTIAYGKLLLGDLPGTKASMDESEKLLEGLANVDNSVWAGFYGVAGDYYKVRRSVAGSWSRRLNSQTPLGC